MCYCNLIRLDKKHFDKYIPNFFESQVNNMLNFLKLCPIFFNLPKETLLKIAIKTEERKYNIRSVILGSTYKTEKINLVRAGNIKVIIL